MPTTTPIRATIPGPGALQLDDDVDSITLTSITAFRTLDKFQSGDVDFTSARPISPDAADFRDTQSAGPSVAQAGSFSGHPRQRRSCGLTLKNNFA